MKLHLLLKVEHNSLIAFDISGARPQLIAQAECIDSEGLAYFGVNQLFQPFLASIETHFGNSKTIRTVLGLDTQQVLAVPRSEVPGTENFELEQALPIDAENMVVRANGQLVLVAIRQRVNPLLDLLSDSKLEVTQVTPVDLVLATSMRSPSKNRKAEVKQDDDSKTESQTVEVPSCSGPKSLVTFEGEEIVSWLSCEVEDEETEFKPIEFEPKVFQRLPFFLDFIEGFSAGLVEKERETKDTLILAVLVFLLALAGTFLIRQNQLEKQAIAIETSILKSVRGTFPEIRRTRRWKKLLEQAIQEQTEQGEWVAENVATVEVLQGLQEFLAAVPKGVRFETKSLSVSKNQIVFQGSVNTVADLKILRTALDSSPHLQLKTSPFGKDFELTFAVLDEGDTK